ncbi:MAG: ABC transporter permease [Candidatus Aminicenantes bacterium]|nr:ABC transporter permease [Candidatus Aminicenantes bacterium]
MKKTNFKKTNPYHQGNRPQNKSRPPRIPRWILSSLNHYEKEFSLTGDCSEEYQQVARQRGKGKAILWIWGQVLYAIPIGFKRSLRFGGTMFFNYLKITLRNIKRHKAFSFINMAGLGIGLAVSIFILIWVRDELSYDNFHEHSERIYRIYEQWVTSQGAINPIAFTPYPLGPTLQDNYPEVLESMHFSIQNRNLVKYKEKRFFEDQFAFADANFFTFFSFPLIKGNPKTVLKELNSLVLSQSMAKKYFGNEDPTGKILTVNAKQNFIITGIMQDIPHNSHIRVGFIGNFECLIANESSKRWVDHQYYTYLRLRPDTDAEAFGVKIKTYINDNQLDPTTIHIALQSLKDIHLRSHFNYDLGGTSQGKALYIYVFSLVAVMVLSIACINFMSLATAKAANRAKEIGIRKVSGASKGHLINQFMGESFFMSVLAFLFSLVCVLVLLPPFNSLTGKNFTIGSVFNASMFLFFLALTVATGVLAGAYPALYLSTFRPSQVLKGKLRSGTKTRYFRRVLVVVQFSLSVILMMGTIVVRNQLSYMQNKNLGIKKDNIVYIRMRGKLLKEQTSFKDELARIPGILNITTSSNSPLNIHWGTTGVDWEGRNPDQRIHWNVLSVDFDFIDTFGLELVEGRGFSHKMATDTHTAYIINETGAQALGFEQVTGKIFNLWETEGIIIGIVRDFHISSLHEKIRPLIIKVHPSWDSFLFLTINAEHAQDVLAQVESIHQNLNPEYPFIYSFLDDDYKALYSSEQRTEKLFQIFSLVAIFLSCLGLFGLSSFMAEQRTKEIGIRKVFGANVPNIIVQLMRDFTKWVLYANLIAWPIGYFVMQRWLKNFAYRTDLEWWIFIVTGLGTLIIAAVTVGYKSLKAAIANPIDTLRYE